MENTNQKKLLKLPAVMNTSKEIEVSCWKGISCVEDIFFTVCKTMHIKNCIA